MIDGHSVLALIPARGGSKGIPHKNIRPLAGKPLIAWTIVAAKKSAYIDRLILSSDDPEIIAVAEAWGCEVPFVRPSELAQDDTPGYLPVLHAMETLASKGRYYDYIVLLQPTSPLRTVADIDGCIEQCVEQKAQFCVTVTDTETSPYWMYKLDQQNRLVPLLTAEKPVLRRQDSLPVYVLNGAVYIGKWESVLQEKSFLNPATKAFIMPHERSIDIDHELDFKIAEYLLQNHSH